VQAPEWATPPKHYEVKEPNLSKIEELLHSIFYSNPAVIKACVNWISRTEVNPDPELSPASMGTFQGPQRHYFENVDGWLIIAVFCMYQWLLYDAVHNLAAEKFDGVNDNEYLLATYGYSPTLSFKGQFSGHKIIRKIIPFGESCTISGKFDFKDWGTHVEMYVNNLSDAANMRKYFWIWNSGDGLSVKFQRKMGLSGVRFAVLNAYISAADSDPSQVDFDMWAHCRQ
jgi:hypothetical protein